MASTIPSRRLAGVVATPARTAGGGLGVGRIRLAALAAGAPVRTVDLHDGDPTVQQEPGQASAVAASAFDPDGARVPVATKPAQQLPVATTVSSEPAVAQQPTLLVDDGGVVGTAVGVHAADDDPGALGMLRWPFRSTTRAGGHAPAGAADTPVTRLGRTSSYQVTPGPSGRVHFTRPCRTGRQLPG